MEHIVTSQTLARPVEIPVEAVRDQLVAAAQDHVLRPGQAVDLPALAARTRLSEPTLRLTLALLAEEGLLCVDGPDTYALRAPSSTEVLDIYDARAGIEGFSARLLAERNDPVLNLQLYRVIDAALACPDYDDRAYFDANHRIHRAMVAGTGNGFLLKCFDDLWRRGAAFGLFAAIENVDFLASLAEHTALVDAIATGDGSLAADRMIAHVRDGYFLKLDASLREPL